MPFYGRPFEPDPARTGVGRHKKPSLRTGTCLRCFFYGIYTMTNFRTKMRKTVIGIAGLGGLGSNVAIALARLCPSGLVIADFDCVEDGNLNRQQYYPDQIGSHKVDAMTANLKRIAPTLRIEAHKVKLTAENIPQIFARAHIIAECFDNPQEKQMIVETVLTKMKQPIVSVSGIAGYGRSNEITTKQLSNRLILVGDDVSGIDKGSILTSTRVGLAAYHQANAIVEVIIDKL